MMTVAGPFDASASRRQFLGASGLCLALAACGGGGGAASGGSGSNTGALPPPAPTPPPGSGVVAISSFYSAGHGTNYQHAVQAAIDHAAANGLDRVVNDFGPIAMEMWSPRRTSAYGETASQSEVLAADGIPLVVRAPMTIDFAGATIRLKGPDGGNRWPGQPISNNERWLGGWLYVIGGEGFGTFALENVIVDGEHPGPYTQDQRNLSDKGFRIQDTSVARVALTNVQLRNFGGEIYYTGGGTGVAEQAITDCHFHGSPQCAFNPGTISRLSALRLRAGRSYQAAEAIGGISHDYQDCEFYDADHVSFLGGPKPNFSSDYPYWYPRWDGIGDPPRVAFSKTVFRNCGHLLAGAWLRGEVELRDTTLLPFWEIGRVHAMELKVTSLCDQAAIYAAVVLHGPDRTGTPVPGAPAGTVLEPPFDLAIELHCDATPEARAKGLSHGTAFGFNGGLVDAQSIRLTASGQASSLTRLFKDPVPGFEMPQVLPSGFVQV